jgi:hypothetical protein
LPLRQVESLRKDSTWRSGNVDHFQHPVALCRVR